MFRTIEYKPQLKRDINWLEEIGIMATLKDLFRRYYKIRDIEDKFGMTYTSTSDYAMYGNTNCNFEIEDGIRLVCFAVHDNGNSPSYPVIIAVGSDEDNNDFYYAVEEI